MKKWIVLMSVVAVAGCATPQNGASAKKPASKPAASVAVAVSPKVQAIANYKFGDSREPLTAVEDLVRESLASPEASKALAAQLTAFVGSSATPDAKQFAWRQLAIIGSAENVPALAPYLLKEDASDMARYALQPIPGKEVDEAFLNALPKASAKIKIGIIDSLGARKSKAAVKALTPLSADKDPQIAAAAKSALARIKG